MKKLLLPSINDEEVITTIADNTRLGRTSYPHLRQQLQVILSQYSEYLLSSGNACKLEPTQISDELKTGLLKHYNSPPNTLDFIEKLRSSSPDICPMCGSLKTGTLDHFFPKKDYPEWAIFSKNLVPACDCNIKRKTILTGDISKQERLLHPYFDRCLGDRQISCSFISINDHRIMDISIYAIDTLHPDINSIQFHIDTILKRSGIISWLKNEWSKLRNKPSNLIHTIPNKEIQHRQDFEICLEEALDRYDDNYGTPNNWHSIFVHGIINSPDILGWLFERHNAILAGNIDPFSE